MSSDADTAQTLRRYLLGTLPEAARPPVEERLLTDAAFLEELLLAEEELIDEYLARTLSPAETESFNTHFLRTAERRHKVQFASALHRYVATHAPDEAATDEATTPAESVPAAVISEDANAAADPSTDRGFSPAPVRRDWSLRAFFRRYNPGLAFASVAAVLFLLAGITWVSLRPHAPGRTVAVFLTPGLTRAAGPGAQLALPPDAETAELRLELPSADYTTYRAELQTPEGRTLHTAADLKPANLEGRPVVLFQVPARLLPPADYQLRLAGTDAAGRSEPAGRYYFRVTNQ
ncbi:MAG TPA: hypothetical protein VF546_07880 [Pyrinomonadaceae bacterium]|jgi:hypothetical protein